MQHSPAGESRSPGNQLRGAEVQIAPWPDGAPFALFLSHDVDQIYDRHFFRLLGDINHLRRVWWNGEPGKTVPCVRRIARSILRPRAPGQDVETILSIERVAGFRSTFFLLEDEVFNRLGGRYRYSDPATKAIARSTEHNGCEIAVHGAVHAFNDPARYRAQANSFRDAFGCEPKGIRNHDLRHGGVETWRAQRAAGYEYDASFGSNDQAGIRDGKTHPFFPFEAGGKLVNDFVVLPVTIMDSTIFRPMRLSAVAAFQLSQQLGEQIKAAEGLFCLSWHNNYFDEPEYSDWQDVYEDLMGWLAAERPWNATGVEIADWWRRRSQVLVDMVQRPDGRLIVEIRCGSVIEGVVVAIKPPRSGISIDVVGVEAAVLDSRNAIEVRLGRMSPAVSIRITLRPPAKGSTAE